MPLPELCIGTSNSKFLTKPLFTNDTRLHLRSFDNENHYFQYCQVDSAVVLLNGKQYYCNGNTLPASLLAAIDKAGSGDKMVFTFVRAIDTHSGRAISVEGNSSFTLQ